MKQVLYVFQKNMIPVRWMIDDENDWWMFPINISNFQFSISKSVKDGFDNK